MPGYRIHGTDIPWGVGMQVSHGCVRLYPEDIEALYPIVPVGAPGEFIYQPVKIGARDGRIYAEVSPDIYTPDARHVRRGAAHHRATRLADASRLEQAAARGRAAERDPDRRHARQPAAAEAARPAPGAARSPAGHGPAMRSRVDMPAADGRRGRGYWPATPRRRRRRPRRRWDRARRVAHAVRLGTEDGAAAVADQHDTAGGIGLRPRVAAVPPHRAAAECCPCAGAATGSPAGRAGARGRARRAAGRRRPIGHRCRLAAHPAPGRGPRCLRAVSVDLVLQSSRPAAQLVALGLQLLIEPPTGRVRAGVPAAARRRSATAGVRRSRARSRARRTMKRRSAPMRAPKRGARNSMPYWPGRGKRDRSISKGLSRSPRSMRWPLPVSVACIGCGPSQLTLTGPVMIAPSAGDSTCGRRRRSSEDVHDHVGCRPPRRH